MAKKQESVTPGQRLGYAADYQQGAGTYERDGLLYASVVGQRYIDPAKDDQVKKNRFVNMPKQFNQLIQY